MGFIKTLLTHDITFEATTSLMQRRRGERERKRISWSDILIFIARRIILLSLWDEREQQTRPGGFVVVSTVSSRVVGKEEVVEIISPLIINSISLYLTLKIFIL